MSIRIVALHFSNPVLYTHHISNANTAVPNLGFNASVVLFGVEWIILR